MIPYDLDPSLYTGEPEPQLLEDGFSPPHQPQPLPKSMPAADAALVEATDPAHWAKSAF